MSVIAYPVEQVSVPPNNAECPVGYPLVFDYAGEIYLSDFRNTSPSGVQTNIGLYKTPNGVTITSLDQAHSPICTFFNAFYPASGGNKVYFAYYESNSADDLRLVDFNLDTGLFGTPITGGPAVRHGQGTFYLAVRSDGTYVIGYSVPSANTVRWVKYDGSWSSPADVTTGGTSLGIAGVGINDSDDTLLLYTRFVSSNYEMASKTLSSGDALTSEFISVPGASPAHGVQIPIGNTPVLWVPGTDEFLFSYNDGVTGFVSLLKISPSANPNTAVLDPVFDATLGEGFEGMSVALNSARNKIYFMTCFMDSSSVTKGIHYKSQVVGSGVWTGPVEAFNPDTDICGTPYNIAPIVGSVHFPVLGILSDGSVAFEFIVEGNPDFNPPAAAGEFFVGALGPPALACPVTTSGNVGVPFSARLIASGGTPPYTFALTGGSLPAGLALNTSTGEISGTPTEYGTFSWTVTVTDANDQTASATCSIFIQHRSRTLRYQLAGKDHPARWFPHLYADPVVTHYLVEPNAGAPNDQELFMLSGGAILKSGGNTDAGAPIISLAEPSSIDAGDERAQKLYVDAMTDADGSGTLTAGIRFNNSDLTGPSLALACTGPRTQFQENIASLADLSLYRNISVRYQWSGGPDGPRVYAFEPSGFLQPYLSTRFVTQFLNLAYPGWKHHRRLYPGMISNAEVIFTIKCQDGRVFTVNIPPTGGQFFIRPLMVPQDCKDLSFAYELDGQGSQFALFPDAFTVETKEWTGPEFLDLAIFKT